VLDHKDFVGPNHLEMPALPIPVYQFKFAVVIEKEASFQLSPGLGYTRRHANRLGHNADLALPAILVQGDFPKDPFHWVSPQSKSLTGTPSAAASFFTL
jgi:hypothetical protein